MRKNYLKSISNSFVNSSPYFQINIVFAGILMLMLAYSGIFSSTKDNHPVKCVHKEILGIECETCGLSRGFSEIVRGNFDAALDFNPHSISVFTFFIVQLLLRFTILVLIAKSPVNQKTIVLTDVVFSSFLFITCFRNIILSWLNLFFIMG